MFWSVIISEIYGSVSRTLIDFWIATIETNYIADNGSVYIWHAECILKNYWPEKSLFANYMKNQ